MRGGVLASAPGGRGLRAVRAPVRLRGGVVRGGEVRFSCKGRGWCPSCTNRRAVETGACLEATLPFVRHPQWTLSIPFSLRFTVVTQPAVLQTLATPRTTFHGVESAQRETAAPRHPPARGRAHFVGASRSSASPCSPRAGDSRPPPPSPAFPSPPDASAPSSPRATTPLAPVRLESGRPRRLHPWRLPPRIPSPPCPALARLLPLAPVSWVVPLSVALTGPSATSPQTSWAA